MRLLLLIVLQLFSLHLARAENIGDADRVFLPVHYDARHEAIVQQRLQHAPPHSAALPTAYEIPRTLLPVIRDQGRRGSCAYFATVGLLESYYMATDTSKSVLNLSVECLLGVRNWMFDQKDNYTGEDKPTQRPDPNGDLPISLIKTIEANGVPVAAQYPSMDCRYKSVGSKAFSLSSYRALFEGDAPQSFAFGKDLRFDHNTAPTIAELQNLIAQNIPVEVGVLVYKDFFYTSSWHYRAIVARSGLAGGHAVMLVGYRTNADGRVIFTFKNSWGKRFGRDGYGTLNQTLLEKSWGYDPDLDFITSMH